MLALLTGAFAAFPAPRNSATPPAEIYRRTLAGIAWVRSADGSKGTGWLLDRSRRLLVTACHVIGDADTADVVFPVTRDGRVLAERAVYLAEMPALRTAGRVVRGRVVRRDIATDLALLHLDSIPTDVAALPLAATSPSPGERVHALGCRYDSDVLWVYTAGIVRQVRTLPEGYFNAGRQYAKGARVLFAQAPINEGDSGGPLVNGRGEVVGVAAAVAWEAQGSSLFIDVSHIRALNNAENPPAVSGPSAGADLYRRGLRGLVLVQATSADKRASGWLADAQRRLVVTTAEAVGKRRADRHVPGHARRRVIADAAHYRENQPPDKMRPTQATGVVLARDPRRNLVLLELDTLAGGAGGAFPWPPKRLPPATPCTSWATRPGSTYSGSTRPPGYGNWGGPTSVKQRTAPTPPCFSSRHRCRRARAAARS